MTSSHNAEDVARRVTFRIAAVDANLGLELEAGERVMSVEYDGAASRFYVIVMTQIDGTDV